MVVQSDQHTGQPPASTRIGAIGAPRSNLFLACTPLQIINAIEARDRFHAHDRNFLVMVHSPRRQSKHRDHLFQLTDSLIDDAWEHVWNLKLTKLSQLFFPLAARGMRTRIGQCDCVYTGGFQTQQCHLINTIPHQSLIIIDGGASTHSVPQLLRNGGKRRRFYSLIPGMRPHLPPGVQPRYFTSYDLDVPKEQVILNDYQILRNRLQSTLPQRDEIVFISQPLERDLNVHVNTRAVIDAAMTYHGVSRFRYLLHPREKHTPEGSERLPCLVELFGLNEGYLPKAFVTYMSSAARSLQMIYGLPVTCYDMTPGLPDSTSEQTKRELAVVYDDFRRSGITVLDLPASAWPGRATTTPVTAGRNAA